MCAALLIISYCLQLNYTRPGLPKLNPRLLENWKNEVKEKGHINCPNNVRTVSVLLWASWSRSAGGRGDFGGQKPTKARFLLGPGVTLGSPRCPGVAAMPG